MPAEISSVSERNPARLREMERLGLRPGVAMMPEAGVRNSSLLVRVNGRAGTIRLSRELAQEISVATDRSAVVAPKTQA